MEGRPAHTNGVWAKYFNLFGAAHLTQPLAQESAKVGRIFDQGLDKRLGPFYKWSVCRTS